MIKDTAASIATSTVKSIVTWSWTKKLLYWLIISAGTMSECAFLIASLWMSVNSSVHPLVMLAMNEDTASHISELATAAYVALPECILALACVTVISHARVYLYDKKMYSAIIWSVLFGLPTLVFLVLSLITLSCSVTSTHFIMPEPLVVTRALAGYMFAFTSLLYTQLGTPQERDRLAKKDSIIASLTAQYNADVSLLFDKSAAMLDGLSQDKDKVIASLTAELNNHKALLVASKNAQSELAKAVNKTADAALQGYSEDCIKWLRSGVKSVSIDEITRYTGHGKRKIDGAITKGYLQLASRNKELILVSSLAEWLKNTPPPVAKTDVDTEPRLHLING